MFITHFVREKLFAARMKGYVIKNSQPIVRMAIGLRGLERKSPIIGSQASLQPANILFPLNRDP